MNSISNDENKYFLNEIFRQNKMISEDNEMIFSNENNKTKPIASNPNQINSNGSNKTNHLRFNTKLRKVECTIKFLQIGEIDTMNERYQAIVEIVARWHENNIKIIEYDANKYWNPKLYVENILYEKSNETISYQVLIQDENNNGNNKNRTFIIETRIVKGWFWERMELNDFPLDVQELSVCLGSKLNPNKCRLISDSNEIFLFNNIRCTALTSQVINTFRDQQKFVVSLCK